MRRDVAGLAGRHADPVDQADAIVLTEYIRVEALNLCAALDARNDMPLAEDHAISYFTFVMSWADKARLLLEQVARA